MLFLLYATALAHADLSNSNLDGFFDNGCPKDPSVPKLLPHENCSQYYKCYHGGLITKLCPYGLHFNPVLEACNWDFKCHDKLIRSKKDSDQNILEETMSDEEDNEELDNDDPKNAYEICKSSGSEGTLVAHENCNEFYKCSHRRPVPLKCAEDLLYNTMTQKCDWSHNVDCGSRLGAIVESHFSISKTNKHGAFPYLPEEIEHSNSDPNQAGAICSSRFSDGVVVAHEYCNKFYKCFAGVPNTMKCPVNLLYNPIKEHCDWPRNVNCDGRAVEILVNKNSRSEERREEDSEENEQRDDDDSRLSTGAAVVCATDDSEGVSVPHDVCSHFYKCIDSEPVAFSCPGDLLFNSDKSYCDWPRNVNCGDRIIPGETSKSDSGQDNDTGDLRLAITICSTEGSDGMFLTHANCNLFYECHDGIPVVVDCPPHLLYNPEKQTCDWPTYVSCNDRKVPTEFKSMVTDEETTDSEK